MDILLVIVNNFLSLTCKVKFALTLTKKNTILIQNCVIQLVVVSLSFTYSLFRDAMPIQNKGFEPAIIEEYLAKMKKSGRSYIIENSEDNSDEYVNFYFVGKYEGKDAVYDAVLYTLRLHHNSEMYEIAEHQAAKRFPEFKAIQYEEDENGDLAILDDIQEEIGLFMAETMLELEEEEAVKVQEHIYIDPNVDFGVGLDAGLNLEVIDEKAIEKFIKDYNEDNLKLDETLYTFQSEDYELN